MSKTERCSFCRELFDASEFPDLQTPAMNCCQPCWHRINDYLIQRNFWLLQKEPVKETESDG